MNVTKEKKQILFFSFILLLFFLNIRQVHADSNIDSEFLAIPSYPTGGRPVYSRPAALGADDFNNDGKSDIATANWYSDDVSILLRK